MQDGTETDDNVTMVTEWATPLSSWLVENKLALLDMKDDPRNLSVTWGLYTLLSALAFVNESAKSIHGNVTPDSVWVTKGGDWKLGGMELCTPLNLPSRAPLLDSHFAHFDMFSSCPRSYQSPERESRSLATLSSEDYWALDVYSVGCLVWEIYGGEVSSSDDLRRAHLSLVSKQLHVSIPPEWKETLARMLDSLPSSRPSSKDILDNCAAFRIPIVGCLLFLDNLALKSPQDKQKFWTSLPTILPKVPSTIAKYRLLPALLQAVDFGAANGSGPGVLTAIFSLGSSLSEEEYKKHLVPTITKLFASLDRATRSFLLSNLPNYVDKIPVSVLQEKVLPHFVTGFVDTSHEMREITVKACLSLAPYVSQADLLNSLVRNLVICTRDAEPSVRVNSIICLGRIGQYIQNPAHRDAELVQPLLQAMRDSFPFTRAAVLRSLTHLLNLEKGSFLPAVMVARKIGPMATAYALDPFEGARTASLTLMMAVHDVLKTENERMKAAEKEAQVQAAMKQESAPIESPSATAAQAYKGAIVGALKSAAQSVVGPIAIPDNKQVNPPPGSSRQPQKSFTPEAKTPVASHNEDIFAEKRPVSTISQPPIDVFSNATLSTPLATALPTKAIHTKVDPFGTLGHQSSISKGFTSAPNALSSAQKPEADVFSGWNDDWSSVSLPDSAPTTSVNKPAIKSATLKNASSSRVAKVVNTSLAYDDLEFSTKAESPLEHSTDALQQVSSQNSSSTTATKKGMSLKDSSNKIVRLDPSSVPLDNWDLDWD